MKRLHLSTLLALVLITGTWVTLNTRDYKSAVTARETAHQIHLVDGGFTESIPDQTLTGEINQRGFPFPMYTGHVGYASFGGPPVLGRVFNYGLLLLNFLTGLCVLGTVAYLLESRAQKKETPPTPSTEPTV